MGASAPFALLRARPEKNKVRLLPSKTNRHTCIRGTTSIDAPGSAHLKPGNGGKPIRLTGFGRIARQRPSFRPRAGLAPCAGSLCKGLGKEFSASRPSMKLGKVYPQSGNLSRGRRRGGGRKNAPRKSNGNKEMKKRLLDKLLSFQGVSIERDVLSDYPLPAFFFAGGETSRFLFHQFSHSVFLEGVRGNHSLIFKEWFPRIIISRFQHYSCGNVSVSAPPETAASLAPRP